MSEQRGLLPHEVASLELPSLLHPFQRDAVIRRELGNLGLKDLVPRHWGLYVQRSQLQEAAEEALAASSVNDLSASLNEQQPGEQSNG